MTLGPFPGQVPWADIADLKKGLPSQTFKQYLSSADVLLRQIVAAGGGGAFVTMLNGTVQASVAGSALTLAIKTLSGADPSPANPVTFVFRDATASLGDYVSIQVTSALSVTIPSGATLGHVSARNQQIILYAINNASTVELAVAVPLFDLSVRLRSTTALSGGSTSPSTLYSTTSRTNVPWYPLARCVSNQTVAGTWAAVPTQIDLAPFALPSNACDIYLASNAALAINGQFLKVPYNAVIRDDDSVAVLANNSIQPTVPGTYAVSIIGYAAAYLAAGATISEGNAGLAKNGQFNGANGAFSGGTFFGRAVSGAANQEAGGSVSSLIPVNGTSDYIQGIFATQGNGTNTLLASTDLNHLTAIRVGP